MLSYTPFAAKSLKHVLFTMTEGILYIEVILHFEPAI